MDLLKAVSIIERDLDEALALLDQLSSVPGSHIIETELAKSRVRSASDLLKLIPRLAVTLPQQEMQKVQAAPAADKIPEVKEAQEPQEPQKIQEPQKTQKTQEPLKSILADRFINAGTLGEKMSSDRHDEVMSSVMHSKPIADIAAAIGMNDKFYFIRELFSGDAVSYNDTVKRLNAAASLGEAMKILDESTVMGSDPAAQSSFVDVVRRKFSIHV